MTREEAIKILHSAIKKPNTKDGYLGQALDMAIKALEQESVLDKIRAEINELPSYVAKFNGGDFAIHIDKEKVFEVIDKYGTEESEEK